MSSDEIDRVDAATEAKALGKLVEALDRLDDDAVRRVLEWAWKRYVKAEHPDALGDAQRSTRVGSSGNDGGLDEAAHRDLADLYGAAKPATAAEKVLVAAYWHQVHGRKESFDSQTLNGQLKDLGHGIANVTRACSTLIDTDPKLMIQVRKSGSTRQARKLYRLTAAGLQRVRGMLESEAE